MKIGIFSGSFNPIHIGHLILANYIVEFTELDELWFLVTPQNPWKESSDLMDEDSRLEMVKIALKDYPKLKASNFEFSLERPSYTHKTLIELDKSFPENEFSLIIGADNWLVFEDWKDYNEILENYPILVYPRLGYDLTEKSGFANVHFLDSPIIEISSSFIRQSLLDKKNVKAFLPNGVYEYLLKNRKLK